MKKRKFLSAVLIGALMISTVPFAAFAEDNEPIPDVLVEEGVTYFDAGSEHFEDSTRLLHSGFAEREKTATLTTPQRRALAEAWLCDSG